MLLILAKILLTLGLVAMNGFFVAAEFASVTARTSRLKVAQTRTIRNRAALNIKTHLDLFLSACQLGVTLSALALGAVTEPFVASLIAPFTQMMHLAPEAEKVVAFIISFAIACSLHIVIGEQAPKNLAIAHADRLLSVVAIPLVAFTYLFYPAIWLLNTATHAVLRPWRIRIAASEGGMPHTEEELLALLMQSAARGSIAKGKAALLANAFEFGDLKVRQIMTPRPEVDFLILDQPVGETLRTVQKSAYTRLPL